MIKDTLQMMRKPVKLSNSTTIRARIVPRPSKSEIDRAIVKAAEIKKKQESKLLLIDSNR